jgi:ubiquitin carboxyl-terminal hydrolase 4/11
LEKVATFSNHQIFKKFKPQGREESPDAEDSTDADLVATTASDADSAGDGKVVARSVEGEDDIVDVTMKDSTEAEKTTPAPPK